MCTRGSFRRQSRARVYIHSSSGARMSSLQEPRQDDGSTDTSHVTMATGSIGRVCPPPPPGRAKQDGRAAVPCDGRPVVRVQVARSPGSDVRGFSGFRSYEEWVVLYRLSEGTSSSLCVCVCVGMPLYVSLVGMVCCFMCLVRWSGTAALEPRPWRRLGMFNMCGMCMCFVASGAWRESLPRRTVHKERVTWG